MDMTPREKEMLMNDIGVMIGDLFDDPKTMECIMCKNPILALEILNTFVDFGQKLKPIYVLACVLGYVGDAHE